MAGKLSAYSKFVFVIYFFLIIAHCLRVETKKCWPNGRLRGKKPPLGECNQGNDSDCCKEGKFYTTY